MNKFIRSIQVRWADMNRHLRHSVYFDFGATARLMFLAEHGLTMQALKDLQLGPVLFREEAIFKRAIGLKTLSRSMFNGKGDTRFQTLEPAAHNL